MPIATPFKALGAGNGFPFCPEKVNVSVYSSWTTLGGYRDTATDDPTDAQISLSLKNAMKLFWSLNGITLDVAETYSNIPNNNYNITIEIDGSTAVDTSPYTQDKDEVEIEWRNLENVAVKENQKPNERVGYRSGSITKRAYRESEYTTQYYSHLKYSIYRMYDGVTTNEDNFVGYGADISTAGGYVYTNEWYLYLSSKSYGDPSTDFCLTEYVDIGGIPCVATFINYYNPVPISDDSNSTVTLSNNGGVVRGHASLTGTYGVDELPYTHTDTLVYKNPNFYTYQST